MIDIGRLFDSYNRTARLYPALITLSPVLVLAVGETPAFASDQGAIWVGLAAATGFLFLLAEVARSFGKKVEQGLLSEWNGWPTTIWLRHGSAHVPEETKKRYHARLGLKLPDLSFPTPEQERIDPDHSDRIYRSAVEWLKEHCRGPEFSLVAKENAGYGFRRNLLGLKPIGLCVALATGIATSLLVPLRETGQTSLFLSLVFCVISLLLWLFVVNKSWVRQGADAYARALLACCETL